MSPQRQTLIKLSFTYKLVDGHDLSCCQQQEEIQLMVERLTPVTDQNKGAGLFS